MSSATGVPLWKPQVTKQEPSAKLREKVAAMLTLSHPGQLLSLPLNGAIHGCLQSAMFLAGYACFWYTPLSTDLGNYFTQVLQGPHRLVVRTSRCGRDNPGSTPGVDNMQSIKSACAKLRKT